MPVTFNHTIIAAKDREKHPGGINNGHGGRGVYFMDPAGHSLEMITRPCL